MNYEFKEMGVNVTFYEPITIINPKVIVLKSNILVSEYSYLAGGLGLYIGNHIHIATHTSISGGGICILEDFSGLSAGVRLITGSADVTGKGMTSPTLPIEYQSVYRSYIHIKKHALLSTNVIVHPGITIGEGAVIASGSIVTKNVDPWCIYMGRPAKKIKDRQKDKIKELEKNIYDKYNIIPSNFSDIVDKLNNNFGF